MSTESDDYLKEVFSLLAQGKLEGSPYHKLAMQAMDNEFAQEVAPLLDKEDWKYLDPKRAKVLGKDLGSVQGINVGAIENPVFQGIPLQPNTVYATQYKFATPALWAHEFRHSRPSLDAKQGNALTTERLNRYEDVFHAIDPASRAWAENALKVWLTAELGREPSEKEFSDKLALVFDMMLNEHK